MDQLATKVIEACRSIAACTEEPGRITRLDRSPALDQVHRLLSGWMQRLDMQVSVDAAGNLHGLYAGSGSAAPRLLIGSHLDTVPDAGAYDGVLGVVLAIALVETLNRRRLPFAIEVLGFFGEEGVRTEPFAGSRAFTDTLGNARGYIELHIEQGPVLESLGLPLAVVDTIVGQSRFDLHFAGRAGHAGTTPMNLRRDALAGAAEWIAAVERETSITTGLVATVGRLEVEPCAGNVIPGDVRTSLDVRHACDEMRLRAVDRILTSAREIAARRNLSLDCVERLNLPSVPMDTALMRSMERAIATAGYPVHRMPSGAGHDAMIVAQKAPAAMLFLRSPGSISHHPDESVLPGDVAASLAVGLEFLCLIS